MGTYVRKSFLLLISSYLKFKRVLCLSVNICILLNYVHILVWYSINFWNEWSGKAITCSQRTFPHACWSSASCKWHFCWSYNVLTLPNNFRKKLFNLQRMKNFAIFFSNWKFPVDLLYSQQAESTSATNESVLKVALDHGKASGVIKSHDRVVVCQKVGDASVVKIIELED